MHQKICFASDYLAFTTLYVFDFIVEGRKKTKDGKTEKKKRSGNSSEEDSAGTIRGSKKKKQKGSGTGNGSGGSTGNGAKAASGEGSYHLMLIITS